ncbi:MAG: lysophospholipid acyltransferase family protein [Candidatus Omnitrophica bacterium]|nr:lysophospholipid acyltransferase family protein [Candidatus Omnitrophota bacterium]MCB9747254.1 lysophospholipid acyltransferase family protein [Candidatus Omnitrophota bacterium]
MNTNESVKRFRRAVARHALFFCSWLFNKLPYSVVKGFSNVVIALGFIVVGRQRKIAKESLEIALGQETTEFERREIVRKCFDNLGRGMIELIYFMEHPAMINERVVIEGKEHLDEAFKKGNGVIGISAHFGSFPLMLLRFAQEGYPTNAIIRPVRDQIIEKHFLNQRSKLGLNTIYSVPRQQCVNTSIKALRNNELLFIPLDQNFGSGSGVFVEFFGQKAATATGPVVFARRTNAAILPMFIVRENHDKHRIIIEKEMELIQSDDEDKFIYENTARITQLIEKYVRRYPQEWGWMHRRWKSRPKQDAVLKK